MLHTAGTNSQGLRLLSLLLLFIKYMIYSKLPLHSTLIFILLFNQTFAFANFLV